MNWFALSSEKGYTDTVGVRVLMTAPEVLQANRASLKEKLQRRDYAAFQIQLCARDDSKLDDFWQYFSRKSHPCSTDGITIVVRVAVSLL